MNDKDIEIKVAEIHTDLKLLREEVKNLRENHIAHIYAKLEALDKKFAYWTGALATLTMAIQIILKFVN